MYAPRTLRLTLSTRTVTLAVLTSLAACAPEGAETSARPASTLQAESVAAPAGSGSGEPSLAATADGVVMTWQERVGAEVHAVRFAAWDGAGWTEPVTVAESTSFFVNWADFPSVHVGPDGVLWVHWLQRGREGGYDYGIRVAHSSDGGATWSEPWTPHEDGTPTEHGFVSAFPVDDAMGFVWLDGRKYTAPDAAAREMTVRFRTATADGATGPEELLDERACDCCQTDAVLTPSGVGVVAYRDRSPGEIRDIYVTRFVDGAWTEGRPVHRDGWEIGGCPVNGPAVAVAGDVLGVAWFTAAGNEPRVKVAFSTDDGATFGAPAVVDDGNPSGRVDLVGLPDGAFLLTWLERIGGESAEVRARLLHSDGSHEQSLAVAAASAARGTGFPRAAVAPDGSVFLAWTDVSGTERRVRLVRIRRAGTEADS